MCFGAIVHARVERVVFAAPDPKVGVSRIQDTLETLNLNHRFAFEGGLLRDESAALIKGFFARRRS